MARLRTLNGRTLAVFGVTLVALIVHRQVSESTWTPRGVDWDSWFQAALAIGRDQVPYPPNRWPLYALLASLGGALLPGPLYLNAQLVSLALTAATVAGVFRLGHVLLGPPAALTVAALAATQPVAIETATWTSCYPLWVAGSIWAVVGLVEAHRGQRHRWWVVAGLGIAVVLASQAKGLGIGLALGALAAASVLLTGRGRLGRLGHLIAPIGLMALLYALFPGPLMTLDAQILSVETALPQDHVAGAMPVQVQPAEIDSAALFDEGYVFGRQMGPTVILGSLRTGSKLTTPEMRAKRLDHTRNVFRAALPHSGPPELWALAAGGALGLLMGAWQVVRRRGWHVLLGWTGIAGIVCGLLPSLVSDLSLRFLLPGIAVAPLLLVALVAVPTGPVRALRWAPLLVLPVALVPGSPWSGSPWLQGAATRDYMSPQLITGGEALQLRAALLQSIPDATVHVFSPASHGILVLDGRPGAFLEGDPRFPGVEVPRISPQDHVLWWQDLVDGEDPQMSGDGPSETRREWQASIFADRPELESWQFFRRMVLLGPKESGG